MGSWISGSHQIWFCPRPQKEYSIPYWMCVNSTQAESLPFSVWKGSNLNNLPSSNRLSLQSEVKVTQSCPTLCGSMDYTVHGILQARILEWVAFPFSRGSSQPRDWTQVSHIAGRIFTSWATREAQKMVLYQELRINLYCWLCQQQKLEVPTVGFYT